MLIRSGTSAGMADPVSIPPGIVRISTPAKVNLFLEIHGKRPDGYHDLSTLIVAVDLYDDLEFAPADDGTTELVCDLPELSVGQDNLIHKAAERLRQKTGSTRGVKIHLTKRIPWAAGLGGGSSDAAATLAGLNILWDLGLSQEELSQLAGELGSDIPFFLNGPAAWCLGRGERIEPVPIGQTLNLVLIKPEEGLSTAEVYRKVRVPTEPRDGTACRTALAEGNAEVIGSTMFNRLQEPAFDLCPAAAEVAQRLGEFGTAGVLLSGSGSCLFALCRDPLEARRVGADLSSGLVSRGDFTTRVLLVRSCS
jgi:4-diphosphocytidyl-2-C-methyl-D-erythritol kinase